MNSKPIALKNVQLVIKSEQIAMKSEQTAMRNEQVTMKSEQGRAQDVIMSHVYFSITTSFLV